MFLHVNPMSLKYAFDGKNWRGKRKKKRMNQNKKW